MCWTTINKNSLFNNSELWKTAGKSHSDVATTQRVGLVYNVIYKIEDLCVVYTAFSFTIYVLLECSILPVLRITCISYYLARQPSEKTWNR